MSRPFPLILGVAGFLALAATLLWLAAGAFAAAQERTSEYRYLSDALDPVTAPSTTVAWLPPVAPLVRPLSPGDEALIGRALTQAWRAFAASQDTGETALLADHFSGPALQRSETAAVQAKATGSQMVLLDQTVCPHFQHLDGSIVQLTATATTVRFALRDDRLAHFELTRDELVTTLTNKTTGWRIFSHERSSARPITAPTGAPLALPRLRGVNYYPAATPWSRFWPEFDPQVTAADLDLITGLNGNALRIFLPLADFGPDAKGAENLVKLRSFLDLAQARNLSVIPTLFDLKPSYRPALWAEDLAYLRRVLPVLAASPAVVLVDLKNQPDLDRPRHGAGLIEAWLTTMILMSRDIAPDLALTIGWSSAETALDQAGLLDAISYHDYAPPDGTGQRLSQVEARAGKKPVLVTEIGTSSYSLLLGFPATPDSQAEDLQDRLAQLSKADAALVWTLHDFAAPEPGAVGRSPWVRRLQSRYGLFDATGAAKPAARAVATAFAAHFTGD